jgi:fructose-specific phosphotransferase system IIA component
MVFLKDFIDIDRIMFFDPPNKQAALSRLVEMSRSDELILDFKRFREAIFKREAIVTTGIGQGVAIPHIKSASVKRFFITVGVFRQGVDWDSLDGQPVQIAFLIGGPENHQQYLQILAKLALIIRNKEKQKAIVEAAGPEEVLAQFSGI